MFPKGTPARRVIDYATNMFFQNGVRQVTMDDIAHSLQMSKRTLYQLFADKEQLIIACIEVLEEDEQRLALKLIEEKRNVLEIILRIIENRLMCLRHVSVQYIADLPRYKSVSEFTANSRAETIKRAVAFFNEGAAQGLFRDDVNFELVMNSIIHKIDEIIRTVDYNETPINECFINIGLFHLRGCCTAKGIELVDLFIERYKQEQNS